MRRTLLVTFFIVCLCYFAFGQARLVRTGIDGNPGCNYDYFDDEYHDPFGNTCDPQSGGGGGGGGSTEACRASCSGDCHGLGGGCSCGSPRTNCVCSGGGCGNYACCGIWNGANVCSTGTCEGTVGPSSLNATGEIVPAVLKNQCWSKSSTTLQPISTTESLSGIETRISNIPELEIFAVKYDAIPGGFRNLRYRIKNNSGKRVVALQIWVQVSDGVNTNRTPQFMDWWARQDLAMPAAGSAPGPQDLWMVSNGGGVRSISLSVGAVVYADGATAGPDTADFKSFLSSSHQKSLARVAMIREVLNLKGVTSVRRLIEHFVNSMPERHVNALLKEALESGGVSALQAEISRLTSLQP